MIFITSHYYNSKFIWIRNSPLISYNWNSVSKV